VNRDGIHDVTVLKLTPQGGAQGQMAELPCDGFHCVGCFCIDAHTRIILAEEMSISIGCMWANTTYSGRPLRCDKMSSIVTSSVYRQSESTKSSRSSFETGVVHATSEKDGSSTNNETLAATKAFDMLAALNNVAFDTFSSG
jgi:hypothetical protein